jgi:hypothetical protein
MVEINREHVQHLVRQNQSLSDRVEALRNRLSSAMTATKNVMSSAGERLTRPGNGAHAVRSLEVFGASFVGGLVQGKAGPDGAHLLGVPAEVIAGGVLEALAYFNVGGEQLAEHAFNFGDGLLSSYTSSLGFQLGSRWRETGHMFADHSHPALPPGSAPAINGPAVKGEISPHQMAQIVSRVRSAAASRGMGHG